MKFILTMNMPVRIKDRVNPQQLVHQVIAEHPAKSVDELAELLNKQDFITVEEFYKDNGDYFSVGKTVLNQRHIGKIKAAN